MMARRKKQSVTISPEEKARLKKLRALQRREARKLNRKARADNPSPARSSSGPLYGDPTWQRDDYEWIRASIAKSFAAKILNDSKERPYWLSIPHKSGVEPVAHAYPCAYFRTPGRVYYSFAFREHRDMIYDKWKELHKARKETADRVTAILRNRRGAP